MSATLWLFLETEPLERAPAEVAVVGFFETERPLRGAAGRADWRLCGLISKLIAAGRLRGAAGEALLVPTGGRLRAPRLLALGLGAPEPFGAPEVGGAAEAVVERLLDLGAQRGALALPGEGPAALSLRPAVEAVAQGAAAGLARRSASLRLSLLVPEAGVARALRGIEAAAAAAHRAGVALRVAQGGGAGGRPGAPVLRDSPARDAP